MKFNSYAKSSRFTAVFTDSDKFRFRTAFDKTHRDRLVHQNWVRDVLEVFALRADIQFSQAVHAFKSGDMEALQAAHARAFRRFEAEYNTWSQEKQQWWSDQHPKGHISARYASQKMEDFCATMTSFWTAALTLRHPLTVIKEKRQPTQEAA